MLLAALAYLVYRWAAWPYAESPSGQDHFVLLADAFLHGHLWLDPDRAARLGDITPFGGHYYVSFPPMPAVLMLPFVATGGATAFNDVLFCIGTGALNAGLAFLAVRRLSLPGFAARGMPVGNSQALATALLLALGTVHFYATATGTVWFVAHVVAVTFLLLYLLECVGAGRPFLAGLALAGAFLARTPTIFGLVFWLALEIRQRERLGELVPRLVLFGLPLAIASALMFAQNVARFGSALDFGYVHMRVASTLAPDLGAYGQFNPHFLARNLTALFVTSPIVSLDRVGPWLQYAGGLAGALHQLLAAPAPGGPPFPVQFDPWGTGLWAVSPALVFALRLPRTEDLYPWATAWITALVVAVPDLLYYNTGWYQYGDRFALDFLPFLLLPTALGLRHPLPRLGWVVFSLLLAVSIVSNFLGTRWFLHLPPYC